MEVLASQYQIKDITLEKFGKLYEAMRSAIHSTCVTWVENICNA